MPEIVEHIGLVIAVIGVTVILWGILLDVVRLVLLEWASLSGRDTLVEREDLRHYLGCTPETAATCIARYVQTRQRCEAGGSVLGRE